MYTCPLFHMADNELWSFEWLNGKVLFTADCQFFCFSGTELPSSLLTPSQENGHMVHVCQLSIHITHIQKACKGHIICIFVLIYCFVS